MKAQIVLGALVSALLLFETPDAEAANSCGSAPLPTTPVGPSTTGVFQYATYLPVVVTAWRLPCSATDSMPVLTLVPQTGSGHAPWLCKTGLTLLQAGGLQTTAFNFRTDPPTINSFCGDVVAPVTVAITPSSTTPAAFDLDLGFSIDWDGSSAGHQAIAVGAFNPGAYNLTPPPGPHSVNIQVQGKNVLYQNCTVTTAAVGGGTQYTASCGLEAPLKSSQFEKYDY